MSDPGYYAQQAARAGADAARRANQAAADSYSLARARSARRQGYPPRWGRAAGCSYPQCTSSHLLPAARMPYPRRTNRTNGTLWDRLLEFLDDL